MALTDGILAYWNFDNDGSGGVSLADSTGNGNTLANSGGVSLGTGIIAGDAVFNGGSYLSFLTTPVTAGGEASFSFWLNTTDSSVEQSIIDQQSSGGYGILIRTNGNSSGYFAVAMNGSGGPAWYPTSYNPPANTWVNIIVTIDSSYNLNIYADSTNVFSTNIGANNGPWNNIGNYFGCTGGNNQFLTGSLDETGIWNRALSQSEVTELYNNGSGVTYPFQLVTTPQYYNNAQNDGDWGNILNWWIDSGFTQQSAFLPTTNTPINLYNQVTQNTQGANQCFCSTASFWSANFAAGLTLQASGVVNMQGSSILAGTTNDGVSMHDSSQIAVTGVIQGDAVLRDSSRNYGTIVGNASVYYDSGNGLLPIGGTVNGYVNYLEWGYIAPCPPSSGGHNAIISRLLHLPWFINV